MMDPNLCIMLHKYQHLERVKQAEHERLVQVISHSAIQVHGMMELHRLFLQWRTRRQKVAKEHHLVEGKVVIPQD